MRRSVGLLCAALCACAESADSASSFEKGAFPGDPAENGPGASADGGAPPERELESLYKAPVATGKYVWVANPRSGRVAFVDIETLAIRTVLAGHQPTHIAPLPPRCSAPCDDDRVIVLNELSKDATVIAASSLVEGGLESWTVPAASGGNSWAIAPSGRFAVAWTDARKVDRADKTDGFQDLAIVDLESRKSTVLAVGYRPVTLGFSAASDKCFAVTQDGISVVDLVDPAGPRVTKNVAISDAPLTDSQTRDVSLTADGAYAFVRRDGQKTVTLVALATGERKTLTFEADVTDLDLSPLGNRAIAIARDAAKVSLLPVPEIWNAPDTFSTITLSGETVGSASFAPGGASALLYTTSTDFERMTVLDLGTEATRTVRLYSPVLAAFPSAVGDYAIVLHPSRPADTGSGEVGAFTLVPVSSDLPAKIVATEAPPMQVAFAADGTRGLVTERDDRSKVFGVTLASFPTLMVQRYALSSPPLAAGISVRTGRAYIAQEHPEGRITFIDFATGQARTLTGFELAARVVDGSRGR